MKKNIILAAAAAASTILLSLSCTKQEDIQSVSEAKVFTGSIEQIQTKTVLVDEVKVNWSEGDLVNINGAVYSATPKGEGKAVFTYKEGEEDPVAQAEGINAALYPASLYDGNGTYLPEFQIYEPGKLNAPMLAVSQTRELTFHNMCGVICFALTGSVKILGIALEADYNALCGAFEPNMSTFKAKMVGSVDDTNNHVGLDCGSNGVQLDTKVPTYFYIYVPETTFPAGSLSARIVGVGGGSKDLETGVDFKVEANNIYTFEYTINSFDSEESEPASDVKRIEIYETSILPGEFTVDANGTKVKFTSGNLVWTSKYGWECDTDPEGRLIKPFENEKDSVNLFLWHDDPAQARLGTVTSAPSTKYLFCDGHKAVFVPEKTDITLSVPSIDYWLYILNHRSVDNRYAKTRYDGMPGLLLFPDVLSDKAAEIVKKYQAEGCISTSNKSDAIFPDENKNIDSENFEILIDGGCVFLPAEAVRSGASVNGGAGNTANGYYWGVWDKGYGIMKFDNKEVYAFWGGDTDASWDEFRDFSYGCSIRLVQIIPAAQGSGQTQRD